MYKNKVNFEFNPSKYSTGGGYSLNTPIVPLTGINSGHGLIKTYNQSVNTHPASWIGGRKTKSRKTKSRKTKSRKTKSRKTKSRKTKSRKTKSRKTKYRKTKYRKTKSRKMKGGNQPYSNISLSNGLKIDYNINNSALANPIPIKAYNKCN